MLEDLNLVILALLDSATVMEEVYIFDGPLTSVDIIAVTRVGSFLKTKIHFS